LVESAKKRQYITGEGDAEEKTAASMLGLFFPVYLGIAAEEKDLSRFEEVLCSHM
jgi:hypothetical protein